MDITVGQLLERCPEGTEILVDGDRERQIRWVHPTEIPDPSDYLEGGEVILTAGVWMDGGTRPATVVRHLREADVAAVGFGLTEKRPTVPAAMVRACAKHSLTLFSVPIEVPFLEIMGVFVEAVSREREAPLEESIRRNERFLWAAGTETPMVSLVNALSRYCSPGIALRDALGDVVATAGRAPAADLAAREAGRTTSFAVGGRDAPEGELLVAAAPEELEMADRGAIEQCLPFLALAFARERALRETQRRFASELVDLLLAGRSMAQAATARLEAFGLSPDEPLAAIVATGAPDELVMETLERELRSHGTRATVTMKRGEVVALAHWTGAEQELGDFCRATVAAVQANGGPVNDVAIGYGEVVTGVADLRKSLIEARHACRIAGSGRGGSCASYSQVGSHLLLVALQDEEVVGHFRSAILRPLEEHDARSQVSLIGTLDAFLRSGGKWRATADELYIHVNTLRHRLRRVEDLTGRDLGDMSDRVDFFLALRSRAEQAESSA